MFCDLTRLVLRARGNGKINLTNGKQMQNNLTSTVLAALIGGFMTYAGPIEAQQTETETETETEAPTRADGLATGSEEVGATYVRSTHGDWELRCIKASEGQKDPCQLYQLLKDQNDNAVAEINMFNLPEGDQLAAGATIVTPLETLLTAQVRIGVDEASPKVYPFTFCTAIGCFARVGFSADDVASFKRGNIAKITVVPAQAPDQTVDLTVSLTGFTAAFDAVIAATAQ